MGLTRRSCILTLLLDYLITSKTRIRLLLKFFTNSRTKAYLRALAEEFNESTNAVRVELNRLSDANLITSENNGRKRMYCANTDHPLFPELQSLTRNYLGLDRIEQVMNRLGDVKLALVTGDYARGQDSGLIDLMIVGDINASLLDKLTKKAEKLINRRIRTLVLSPLEFEQMKGGHGIEDALVLWSGAADTA